MVCLQEQPLLLEELLEQEKREQEKQNMSPGNNLNAALSPLSDADFERLRADVLSSSGINGSTQALLSPQGEPFFLVYSSYSFLTNILKGCFCRSKYATNTNANRQRSSD